MKRGGVLFFSVLILLGIASLFFDKTLAVFFKSLQNPITTPIFSIFEPNLFILLFAISIIVFALIKGRKGYTLPILLSLILSAIASYAIKILVMRPRPFNIVETLPILNVIDYSFPSSHCVAMFALLPILDKEFKKLKYLWLTIALLIAFARLYFGVHYFSDVLFGSIIGYGIGLFVKNRMNKKPKSKKS